MWKKILFEYFGNYDEEKSAEQVVQEKILESEFPKHPYYPIDLKLPTFTEKTHSMEYSLGVFAGIAITVSLISSLIIYQKQNVSKINKVAFVWFIITGSIHVFVEGYFTSFHETLQSDNSLIGQWWKEYSLSDSRYLSSDSFVVIMERITAIFWGTGSYLAAIGIYQNWPSRHVIQLVTSLGQLYGLVLYYWTTLFEGFPHSRPEALYFWGYFIGVNSFWALIPGILFIQSWIHLTNAVRENQKRKSKKTD
ncbi:Emopamil binding protein [Glomus cerebriforme]|uniref:Emopamil binding protein n=1 Tax=Glomus cerebriforme TaxID=658196 RepID=A0A397THE8_9GLOM|nr:Emopamil binding protein [Glomus cerebriforme]